MSQNLADGIVAGLDLGTALAGLIIGGIIRLTRDKHIVKFVNRHAHEIRIAALITGITKNNETYDKVIGWFYCSPGEKMDCDLKYEYRSTYQYYYAECPTCGVRWNGHMYSYVPYRGGEFKKKIRNIYYGDEDEREVGFFGVDCSGLDYKTLTLS